MDVNDRKRKGLRVHFVVPTEDSVALAEPLRLLGVLGEPPKSLMNSDPEMTASWLEKPASTKSM